MFHLAENEIYHRCACLPMTYSTIFKNKLNSLPFALVVRMGSAPIGIIKSRAHLSRKRISSVKRNRMNLI